VGGDCWGTAGGVCGACFVGAELGGGDCCFGAFTGGGGCFGNCDGGEEAVVGAVGGCFVGAGCGSERVMVGIGAGFFTFLSSFKKMNSNS
jgi:hypothetical protein